MAPRPFLAKNAHSLFLLFQVEAIIHPQFLADLLSPEPQLDPLALAEELEQEEGLTPEEVSRRGRDTYGACGWGPHVTQGSQGREGPQVEQGRQGSPR